METICKYAQDRGLANNTGGTIYHAATETVADFYKITEAVELINKIAAGLGLDEEVTQENLFFAMYNSGVGVEIKLGEFCVCFNEAENNEENN